MTLTRSKIDILSYVPSQFKDSATRRKGGGGWLRLQKVIDLSNRENTEYQLVTFNSSFWCSISYVIPHTFLSMFHTLKQSKQIVKTKNVSLILCPIEDPSIMFFSYLSSKITNRKFVIFLNSVPYFGLADVQANCSEEGSAYGALFKNMRLAGKSIVRSSLGALLWCVSFKILKSSATKSMRHLIATLNEERYPVVTWVVAKK